MKKITHPPEVCIVVRQVSSAAAFNSIYLKMKGGKNVKNG